MKLSRSTTLLAGLISPALVWALAAVVVAGAYGLWWYRTQEREAAVAEQRALLANAQDRRLQLAAALPEPGGQQAEDVQVALAEFQERLVRSSEGVPVMDAVAGLLQRLGLLESSLSMGGANSTTLAGQGYTTMQLSLNTQGDHAKVLQLVDALQSDMLPGMTVRQLSISYSGADEGQDEGDEQAQNQVQGENPAPRRDRLRASISMTLALHTLPQEEARRSLPEALLAAGPAAEPAARAVPVGAASAGLLAWSVRGEGDRQEALQGVTLAYQAPPGAVVAFLLYARDLGDESAEDTLIARSPVSGDEGQVVLAPATPYAFSPASGARFHLAVETASVEPEGSVEVLVPPGGIVYTSTHWPGAGQAADFHVELPLHRRPAAPLVLMEVESGVETGIPLEYPQGPATFHVMTGPAHGRLTGTPPNLTYVPEAGFTGHDRLTYKLDDGLLRSTTGLVWITVVPFKPAPVAHDLEAPLAPEGTTPITLDGRDADGGPLEYTILEGPAHGVLEGEGAEWTYTPDGELRDDSFTYQVSDGRKESAPATVTLFAPGAPSNGEGGQEETSPDEGGEE